MRRFTDNQINIAKKLRDVGLPQNQQLLTYHLGIDNRVHFITKNIEDHEWDLFVAFLPMENDCYEFLNNMRLYDRLTFYEHKRDFVITHTLVKKPEHISDLSKESTVVEEFSNMLKNFDKEPDKYWYSCANNELTSLYLIINQFLESIKRLKS